jgi:hypothetical protein
MKFPVSTCPREGVFSALPSAEAFEAQTAWFRAQLASGVIDCAHHAPDRAVLIFNAESQAALEKLIDALPLAHQMARKIEPLADFWEHSAGVAAYLRRHAKAKPDRAPAR